MQFKAKPCLIINLKLKSWPVPYASMFGPPAIGIINANDDAKQTTKSIFNGETHKLAATSMSIGPKISTLAMLEMTSVRKQMTITTTATKAISGIGLIKDATQAANPLT